MIIFIYLDMRLFIIFRCRFLESQHINHYNINILVFQCLQVISREFAEKMIIIGKFYINNYHDLKKSDKETF